MGRLAGLSTATPLVIALILMRRSPPVDAEPTHPVLAPPHRPAPRTAGTAGTAGPPERPQAAMRSGGPWASTSWCANSMKSPARPRNGSYGR